MTDIKMRVVTWVDGDNPADDISEELKAVFNGRECPVVYEVQTGGSWQGVVVASQPVPVSVAQQFHDTFVKSIG